MERQDVLFGIGLVLLAGMAFELMVAGLDHAAETHFSGEVIKTWQWWYIGVCLSLTVVLSCVIWSARHIFRRLHVRYWIGDPMPKPYLIFFVSRQKHIKSISEILEDGPMIVQDVTLPRKNLLDDAELLDKTQKWEWEMVLRGISPHLPQLRRVYLVGSKDSPDKKSLGTFEQCGWLHRFLAPYLVAAGKSATISGVGPMIVTWPEPVDFESFADVYQTLEAIRDQLSEDRAEDVELCVDITGGQKPTSAAAGLFTVNNDVVIQYVQTNQPKKPQMYDVRLLEWPKKAE